MTALTRQAVMAYAVLAVMLWLIWSLLVSPFYQQWQSDKIKSHQLQGDLKKIQTDLIQAEQDSATVVSELQSLVASGVLSYKGQASDDGNQMQAHVKSMMMKNSASVSQMRPSKQLVANGLSKFSLILNAQLPVSQLQTLLTTLEESDPSLGIELLSVQSNARLSRRAFDLVNISMTLVMWSVAEGALTSEGALSAEGSISAEGSPKPKPSIKQANVLTGLFDLNARQRVKTPSVDFYRLAGVNLSQSARSAIVITNAEKRSLKLKEGDMLDVWTVDAINVDGVKLTMDGKSEFLKMPK